MTVAIAEVIAAAVQLPVFLMYDSNASGQGQGQGQWREEAYAVVAAHWHNNNSSSGWANRSTVDLVDAVASIVSTELHARLAKESATDNAAQLWQARSQEQSEERHCIWTTQCKILLDWLRDVPLAEITALAELWMKRNDGIADLVQTHPLLAPVRNRLNTLVPAHRKVQAMPSHLTLTEGDARQSVSVLGLVAIWRTLYEYGQSSTGIANVQGWRAGTFPWHAARPADGHVVLQSVEVLVRCLSNISGWNLGYDPTFGQNNHHWLAHTGECTQLTTAALEVWDSVPESVQKALLEQAEGQVFALVVAHGTAGE